MEGKKEREEIEETPVALPATVESTVAAESDGFTHNMELLSQSYNGYIFSGMDIKKQGIPITKDRPLPIYLKFEDVKYKVKNSHLPFSQQRAVEKCIESQQSVEQQDDYKQILKGLSGSAGPGEILALLGPSGSGKTTLLKIVAGRLHEHVSGIVTYSDTPCTPALKRRIGFVAQDDVLFPQLTVEETLIFSAFLRLPSKMSNVQKRARVEMIVKELGLERCQHTRIGGELTRGLSGGERKRTCIGYEILVDPSLLLLDEPTSGLDSTTAAKLLQTLQGLSRGGRTVVTTIHQPSSKMFLMFDKILLISDGWPVYYGKADRSMEYFSSLRFNPEITMNPAEFLLDLATGQVDGIRIPQELRELEGTPEFDLRVVKFLRLRFEEKLGMKAKDENLRIVENHLRETGET